MNRKEADTEPGIEPRLSNVEYGISFKQFFFQDFFFLERQIYREGEKDLSSFGSFRKWLQWPRLS